MYQSAKVTMLLKIISDPSWPVHAKSAFEKGRNILLSSLAPPTSANR